MRHVTQTKSRRTVLKSVIGLAGASAATKLASGNEGFSPGLVDEVSDTDTVAPYSGSARAGQGSSLGYYGSFWDSGQQQWKHSLRLATGAKGIAYQPDNPEQPSPPPVFRKQRYSINPQGSSVGVDVSTNPDFYGIAPDSSNNDVLEETAQTVLGLAASAINPWLGAGYKFGDLAYHLVSPSLSSGGGSGFEYTRNYESIWGDWEGVSWASHYQHFYVDQPDCSSIRGCSDTELTTVTTEMIGSPNYGVYDHDTQVEFEIHTSPTEDDGSVGTFTNLDDSLHPEEMSESTKKDLGLQEVSSSSVTSDDNNFSYYASNFPLNIDSK